MLIEFQETTHANLDGLIPLAIFLILGKVREKIKNSCCPFRVLERSEQVVVCLVFNVSTYVLFVSKY